MTTHDNKPEAKSFYGCPNRRCPVKWWPLDSGMERCPNCDTQGLYIGMSVKIPDVPVPEEPN